MSLFQVAHTIQISQVAFHIGTTATQWAGKTFQWVNTLLFKLKSLICRFSLIVDMREEKTKLYKSIPRCPQTHCGTYERIHIHTHTPYINNNNNNKQPNIKQRNYDWDDIKFKTKYQSSDFFSKVIVIVLYNQLYNLVFQAMGGLTLIQSISHGISQCTRYQTHCKDE